MTLYKTLVHLPPVHRSYKGGFAMLSYCPSCNKVALKEDMHPVRPCPGCGTTVQDVGQGRWQRIHGGMFQQESGEWVFTSGARAAIDKFYEEAYKIFIDRSNAFGEGALSQPTESIPFSSGDLDLDFTKPNSVDDDLIDLDFTK